MPDESGGSDRPRTRWTFWRVLYRLFLFSAVLLALCVVAGGVAAFIVYDHVVQPGTPGAIVEVAVPKGASGRDIGVLLAQSGVIEREAFFRFALKLDPAPQPIRHGVYELPKGLSARQLLELLHAGPAHMLPSEQIKITVPEGLAIPQVAALFPNPAAFAAAASDKELLAKLGVAAASLEGFLMPDTYFFDAQPPERVMAERMIDQFQAAYGRLLSEIPAAAQYDVLKIVTVASLIEEEARVEEERPLVAAVIYNRLEKKMPLQLDSTLQFVLGKYGQRMLDADKQVDSPYNTYKYAGLPPGPISSPGLSSLRAALEPAEVKYLYFVSNADGKTHTFSGTYAEHGKAVGRYRKEMLKQRRQESGR